MYVFNDNDYDLVLEMMAKEVFDPHEDSFVKELATDKVLEKTLKKSKLMKEARDLVSINLYTSILDLV